MEYAQAVVKKTVNAPKYVRKQCRLYLKIINGRDKKYTIDKEKRHQIIALCQLLIVPRGLSAGKTVFEAFAGFQWLFLFAVLTVVHRENFQNARVTYDTNRNMYVNKKKSSGKVDMVVALINALFLLQKYELQDETMDFVAEFYR